MLFERYLFGVLSHSQNEVNNNEERLCITSPEIGKERCYSYYLSFTNRVNLNSITLFKHICEIKEETFKSLITKEDILGKKKLKKEMTMAADYVGNKDCTCQNMLKTNC